MSNKQLFRRPNTFILLALMALVVSSIILAIYFPSIFADRTLILLLLLLMVKTFLFFWQIALIMTATMIPIMLGISWLLRKKLFASNF